MDAPRLDPSLPLDAGAPAPGLRRRWIWATVAGAAILALLGIVSRSGGRHPQGAAMRGAGHPTPVLVAQARTGDMSLSLTGLGTVTPLDTVTVRTRVDGQLDQVAFHEGQLVRAGELLAQIDPRPFQVQLMQAEGQLAKDQAALKNASLDLDRFKNLAKQGILARQQLDAQTSLVNQGEAAIKADQAQVESAKLNLTYSRITAPISGRVGLRQVDPGNMVHASDANGIAVITPVNPIYVVFTIPADHIQRVMARTRQGAHLAVEAYDRDMTQLIARGELEAIDNQVDPTTGTVRMKARFPNGDGSLFPNQFVNAKLLVDTLHDAVIIPTAALQRGAQGTFVYVVKPDHTVDLRVVEIQATEGDSTAVRSGLKAGEEVVTDGMEKLRPGSRVSFGGGGAPGHPGMKP
jgi:multidrug efflux system membrane fusion protein